MKRVAQQQRVDPCATPGMLFQRGISTRLVPNCLTCCDVGQIGNPNWHVNENGNLDRTEWIKGWVLNQLSTRAKVDCEEAPAISRRHAGGWWADAFRSTSVASTGRSFVSGSKLWSLQWSKTVDETLRIAEHYAQDALGYLVTWGIASSVRVSVAYISKTVLRLTVTVTGPSFEATTTLQGQALPDFQWLWREEAADQRRAA